MHTALRKTWSDSNGNLVEDGDPSAAHLVARQGQEFPTSDLARYENAADFFSGFADSETPPAPPAPPPVSPRRKKPDPE